MSRKNREVSTSDLAGLAAACALLLQAIPGAAQGQPGRLLFGPRNDVILECNTDGTHCFSVVGGDPTHQVSAAKEPSMAANGAIAFEAVWGADGTCVVGGQGICQTHVFLMDADGSNVRQLTFNPVSPADFGGDSNVSISPDGTRVAFVSNRNAVLDSGGGAHYINQIYVMNTDGSGLQQLTFSAFDTAGNPQGGGMSSVAWSPDGTKLAFAGNLYTSACGTFFGSPINVGYVGALSLAGGAAPPDHACTGDNGGATALDWSPDGTLIAYGRDSGDPAIAFLDLSGQGRFAGGLTEVQLGTRCSGEPHHCFHFSPDSSRLVYENKTSNAFSFIDLDGANPGGFGNLWSSYPDSGVWWTAGAAGPAPSQLALAPDPIEVWPGVSRQLVPTLLDPAGNAIFHAASTYAVAVDYGTSGCVSIGPFGLGFYAGSGTGRGSVSATNAGATSNSVAFKCWTSPPCTYSLAFNSENFSASGGSDSVGVLANPGGSDSTCPWNAATSASWITITSGPDGSGNNLVSFSVAANSGAARESSMTIAGATFTVTQDQAGLPTLQSISVSPAAPSIPAGFAQQFTASGTYSDGTAQDLTASAAWSSSNTSVATVSNAAGSQGRATGVAAGGPVTIAASAGAVSGSALLTVTAPILTSLAVTPTTPVVPVGNTQQFTATGTYSDGSTQVITGSVTWSSSSPSVASISGGGLASALGPGATTISAQQAGITGSTTMTVISLQSLTISPLNPSVVAGSTIQFAATGHYSDGSVRDLTSTAVWSSSKTSVATITSPGGLATGRAKGSTTIKAVVGSLSASTTLTVNALVLQSIAVTPATASISVRGIQQFSAVGTYNNGTTSDITSSVSWSASPKMVASVSASGLATGLKAGTATIAAKLGGVTGSATLTVR